MGKRGPKPSGVSWRVGGVSVVNCFGQTGSGSNSDTSDDEAIGALKTALFQKIVREYGEYELIVFLKLSLPQRAEYCLLNGLTHEWKQITDHIKGKKPCQEL